MYLTNAARLTPSYRADVDGLRAIAVISVIIYHAFPTLMPSGFLGVDIFFVISGYLITLILLQEIRSTSKLDLLGFYLRRARRILPALIIVLAATWLIFWFVMLANEYDRLGDEMALAAVFWSNFYHWWSTDYFSTSAKKLPLLHLWSLAIEEQFYLVWPLVLLSFSRWRGALLIAIAVLSLGSFLYFFVIADRYPVEAFYSPLSRAWELLAGAALAWLTQARDGRRWPAILALLLAISGTTLTASALTGVVSDNVIGLRLAAVTGAALLIASLPDAPSLRGMYAWQPLCALGLISYPLYLWHVPLLVSAYLSYGGTPPAQVRLALLLASLFLASVTWMVVERPVKEWPRGFGRPAGLVVLLVALGGLGLATSALDGIPSRQVHLDNDLARSGGLESGRERTEIGCLAYEDGEPRSHVFCRREKAKRPPFVVWGDSKADALFYGLLRAGFVDPPGWQEIGATGCAPFRGTQPDDPNRCNAVNARAYAAILADASITTVALVGAFRSVSGNLEGARREYGAIIAALTRAHRQVILVIDHPTVSKPGQNGDDCVRVTALPFSLRQDPIHRCTIRYVEHLAETAAYREMMLNLAATYEQLKLIDLADLLCNHTTGNCDATMEGALLYSYGDHLSDHGNSIVARVIHPMALEHWLKTRKEAQSVSAN